MPSPPIGIENNHEVGEICNFQANLKISWKQYKTVTY